MMTKGKPFWLHGLRKELMHRKKELPRGDRIACGVRSAKGVWYRGRRSRTRMSVDQASARVYGGLAGQDVGVWFLAQSAGVLGGVGRGGRNVRRTGFASGRRTTLHSAIGPLSVWLVRADGGRS